MNRSPPAPPSGWQIAVPWIVAAYTVQALEYTMSTVAELAAEYPQVQAELGKLETDITSLISLVGSIKPGLSPEDQAAVDALFNSMQSDTAAAAAADATAQGTLNPTPAPTDGSTPTDTGTTEAPPSV